jgi:hypothetical protein
MTDPNEHQLSLTAEALTFLRESSGWGTFLAIVGFVYATMMMCLGFFAGSIFASMPNTTGGQMGGAASVIIGAVYVGIGVLYIFPSLYLYRFSQEVKNSLSAKSTPAMTTALENLKSLFKFMGIFTAITLGLLVLIIGTVGLGTMFG